MLLWAMFFLGLAFGALARWGRFCLLRGLRQLAGTDANESPGSAPALQAFALAAAVALVGSQALQMAGLIDLSTALMVRPQFSLVGVFAGGVIFALGMVLANACGARSLVLLAGGNLRSLVTVVFLALGAQASSTGILAPVRQALQSLAPTTVDSTTLPSLLQAQGWNPALVLALTALLPALLLTAYALHRPALRRSAPQLLAALGIGALVAAGWWISAQVAVDPFEPRKLTSLSFIAPLAESLLYVQLAVGREFQAPIALVAGVLLGAGLIAVLSRTARWEGFESPRQLAQSAAGGWLMGFGGLLAAGCSIGQGLSGLSTLAWATWPALAGIVLGGGLFVKIIARQR